MPDSDMSDDESRQRLMGGPAYLLGGCEPDQTVWVSERNGFPTSQTLCAAIIWRVLAAGAYLFPYGPSTSPSMADEFQPKDYGDALEYLRHNFARHYAVNRAPFNLFIHASWFNRYPFVFDVRKMERD
jgi:hypothetical protein